MCVNAVDALGVFIVIDPPIATLDADNDGVVALGIVERVLLLDALTVPELVAVGIEQEDETVLVPSELWYIFTVFDTKV